MNKQETINGIDCYGRLRYGKAVELIFKDHDDSITVIANASNWEDFITNMTSQFAPISEAVAEA